MNEGQEPAQPLEYQHDWLIPPKWNLYRRFGSTSGGLRCRRSSMTMRARLRLLRSRYKVKCDRTSGSTLNKGGITNGK